MLSLRAQGDPKEAKPGAEDVNSHMTENSKWPMASWICRT